ncbi:class A sortase [Lacticaseibacillus kribbianus]|uniref:class A sortase n=1 Tax=Lacticaseibacillus kribbianus TaxID=2926292 RepID=UPI001CD34F51|nr:class A sortase [Lacticaseibacillus kribbianus]
MTRRWLWFLPAALLLAAAVLAGGLVWRNLERAPALDGQAMRANAARVAKAGAPTQRTPISEVDAKTYVAAQTQAASLQRQSGYAALIIPSVDITLPVFGRMSNATLSAGVARYFTDRPLGEGNNVFAAHNFHQDKVLLGAINRLKKGAAVYLSDGRRVFTYHVVDNRVVKQTETAVLAQTQEDRVTLIRCEGPIGTAYRRVVVARRAATTAAAATRVRRQVAAPPSQPQRWLRARPWYGAFALLFLGGRVTGWLWGLLGAFVFLMLLGGVGFVAGPPRRATTAA